MSTRQPQELPYSGIAVASYYEGWVRVPVHRIILGRYFSTMDDMTEALGEALNSEDEALQQNIAVSGLRKYVASLRPMPGGSWYDKKENKHYLRTTRDIGESHLPLWSPREEGTRGPYHTLLEERVSVFDFAPLVKHIMTNTELQDCYGLPKDPRLDIVESIQSAPVHLGAS